jgi:copper(I)-binding protein
MQVRQLIFASIAALAMIGSSLAGAYAEDVKAGDLVISQAWSRATPSGAKVGGSYLTIENKGTAADKLISASSDAAGSVQVHEMSMTGGTMKMRPVEGGLAIDPGKTVKLAPGGYHLMMMDLKNPLKQGDKISMTLEFAKAGKVQVSFDVMGVGAQGPGADSGNKMQMKKDMKM